MIANTRRRGKRWGGWRLAGTLAWLLLWLEDRPSGSGVLAASESTANSPVPSAERVGEAWEFVGGKDVPPWVLNPAQCRVVNVRGESCLAIEEGEDPYTRVQWRLRVPPPRDGEGRGAVLEIQFVDEGAGIIEPRWLINPQSREEALAPIRRRSYTRLNSGEVRRAWFEFRVPKLEQSGTNTMEMRIAGLQYLRGIRWRLMPDEATWEAHRPPRSVKPMVTLERPMQLVTTAGVDVVGDPSALAASLAALDELAPLARVLGFTSIESYVTWKRLEPRREGEFDFGFYDAIVRKLAEYELKWFPLLIVGSGYALPDWFLSDRENAGFICAEHGRSNAIQSIWSPFHRRHVTRVLQAFGQHYEATGVLEGVRLGPSGNYGESQYPAGGNWGPKNRAMHIHIGWWSADPYGQSDFRRWLAAKYPTVVDLNRAWESDYQAFDQVRDLWPATMLSKRQRLDFTAWYTDSMSDWCAWWAHEARRVLPKTPIYQSAGGWGFRETGTDYSAQTKAMSEVDGGVRLTNETDSYEQNFCVTRLAATAARLYRVGLGFEPASSHTARGVVGRIFHTAACNGDHWFTYHGNLFDHPLSIAKWLRYLPVLDSRQAPVVDVAVYYPETENQLGDAAFRHLYAWGFYPLAREIRRVVEVDYLDERLIREDYLDRYRVLVFAWGNQIEADVQAIVDRWLRAGGTVVYPSFPRGAQQTIEGKTATFERWSRGDAERGRFHRFQGDMEPPSGYGEFVEGVLRQTPNLHRWTRKALQVEHPEQVFFSVQADGHLLVLNYRGQPARVMLPGEFDQVVEPYGIARIRLEE